MSQDLYIEYSTKLFLIDKLIRANKNHKFSKFLYYDKFTEIIEKKNECHIKNSHISIHLKHTIGYKATVISENYMTVNYDTSYFNKKYSGTIIKAPYIQNHLDNEFLVKLICKIPKSQELYGNVLVLIQSVPEFIRFFHCGNGQFRVLTEYGMFLFDLNSKITNFIIFKTNMMKPLLVEKTHSGHQKATMIYENNDYKIVLESIC